MRAVVLVGLVLVAGCKKEQAPLPARAEASAERAVEYFARRPQQVAKTSLFALDYLRRKFGVEKLQPVVATWARGNAHEVEVMRPMARWLDASVPALPRGTPFKHPFETILYEGLHCAEAGFNAANFDRDLKKLIVAQGYGVTHAAIAARLARENGCLSAEALATLEAIEVPSMLRIADTEKANLDLFFEVLALLHYLDAGKQVKPEWVERVLAAQHEDGGWGMEPSDTVSRDHPTALALWVLLEVARPGTPPIEWLPRGVAVEADAGALQTP